MRKQNTLWFLVLVVSTAFAFKASADAFRLASQDAFASARGEAYVATADNPSAIYYNPAGITQLEGNNLRVGAYGIYLDPTYSPPSGATNSGNTYDNQKNYAAVPQFYYTYGQTNFPLSAGLGVFSPYGLSSEWPQDTGFRTIGIKGSLIYITINPTLAWKITPGLSLGGGLDVNYADIELEQGLSPIPNNDLLRFTGNGWSVGYNFGVLWQPLSKVSLGVSFRSSSTVTMKGHTDFEVPGLSVRQSAQADFDFPLDVVCGLSYRPTPEWNLEFDADYMDWSSIGTITIHQAAALPPFLPQDISVPLNWQPSWLYKFGVTRYFDNNWHVSAGYVYNENSIPDSTYNPLVADLNRHFFALGTGYKGKTFNFDIAYQLGYGPTRTVSGYVAPPGSAAQIYGQSANGNYDYISHALLVTVGWHF